MAAPFANGTGNEERTREAAPDSLSGLSSLLTSTDNAASQAYLNHLTTLPLSTLVVEPETLQTQAHHLTSSLTTLTLTSYPTFLSLHQTTAALTASLTSLESSLDALLNTSLPALESSAASWKSRTDDVLSERRKARVVLEQHDKIRDLLEIPMLIDTCVRNGYFAEALSLASHARSVSLAPVPKILTSVLAEVQNSMTQMMLSLLSTLHEPSRKLPALWKAVNFLRKMEVFDESSGVSGEEQIALAFLGGREACLRTALEGISRDVLRLAGGTGIGDREKEDLARFLKKYIDAWREGVHDVVTQFTTIFLERSPAPASPATSVFALHSLLTTYTTQALTTHLLPILSQTLSVLPISALPSLLTQLTYCATAFARVGLDFRGVLSGLFCTAVLATVGADLKAVGAKWIERVSSATGDITPPSTSLRKGTKITAPSQWLIVPSLAASPPEGPFPESAAHVPPQVIASYPPLAEYTNAVLTVLNGMRLLAPISICDQLRSVLDGVLSDSGAALRSYVRRSCDGQDLRTATSEEREREERIAVAAGQIFFTVLTPFLRRALSEGVYGTPLSDDVLEGVREWESWLAIRTGE